MLNDMNLIINRLKKDTNNIGDIVYRKKKINKNEICIIFNEPLASSDKISEFIFKSLNYISKEKNKNIVELLINNIDNFKVKKINTYEELCFYLHRGFTIILINGEM